jgi:hypothetical protein
MPTRGLWSKYRHAHKSVADLEALREKLVRSRPRTRGKKAAKTRTLNKLARRIPAAKGLLTKARNAIAAESRSRAAIKGVNRQQRSAAAKKGWATRRAGLAAPARSGGKFMPMLTRAGIVWINPVGDDRSLLGSYWIAVGDHLNNTPTFALYGFEGLSVVDSETGESFPFITDLNTIFGYHDQYDFGPSFYRSRGEVGKASE